MTVEDPTTLGALAGAHDSRRLAGWRDAVAGLIDTETIGAHATSETATVRA